MNLVQLIRICGLSIAVWAYFGIASPAVAYVPLRTQTGLAAPVRETAVRVRTARVVLADYGLIRRDFAETRELSDAQIDDWLLSKTAFVSKVQADQSLTNTRIETGAGTVQAFRPADYGRALVFETGGGGFIDGKGAGAASSPVLNDHANGLATLGEATREFLYEKLVRTVFVAGGTGMETVEHYAVIDWGFDVIHADGTHSPAGMVLRQAHSRAAAGDSVFHDTRARLVEMNLRRFGLTSTGAYRNDLPMEAINIQRTKDGAVLDFGGFLSVEHFERLVSNFNGFDVLLRPGQIDFVQPDESLRVPFEKWGYGVTGVADPKLDNPWVWSHQLANEFRAGRASRDAFKAHFENLVGSYRRTLYMTAEPAEAAALEVLVRGLRDIH